VKGTDPAGLAQSEPKTGSADLRKGKIPEGPRIVQVVIDENNKTKSFLENMGRLNSFDKTSKDELLKDVIGHLDLKYREKGSKDEDLWKLKSTIVRLAKAGELPSEQKRLLEKLSENNDPLRNALGASGYEFSYKIQRTYQGTGKSPIPTPPSAPALSVAGSKKADPSTVQKPDPGPSRSGDQDPKPTSKTPSRASSMSRAWAFGSVDSRERDGL
jgi:hypothetical protein